MLNGFRGISAFHLHDADFFFFATVLPLSMSSLSQPLWDLPLHCSLFRGQFSLRGNGRYMRLTGLGLNPQEKTNCKMPVLKDWSQDFMNQCWNVHLNIDLIFFFFSSFFLFCFCVFVVVFVFSHPVLTVTEYSAKTRYWPLFNTIIQEQKGR